MNQNVDKNIIMKKIKAEHIDCPVCNSSDYEMVYEKEYRVWDKDRLFTRNAQQVICKDCGMIFTNPQPTSEVLKWFYESYMRFGEASGYHSKSQLEFIHSNTPGRRRTLFDIGAFNGLFLNVAKSKGYTVSGIEPSEEGVQEARSRYGIKLIKAFFDKKFLDSFNKKFDVVTINGVLEHITDPIGFLKLALKITNPHKYIFIGVADTDRPFAENIADSFSIEHIMHYTTHSLRNIANRLGTRIVAFERTPQKKSVIRVILKNQKGPKIPLSNEYETNKRIIQEYKNRKKNFMEKIKSRISNTRRIIIYGAGMHTSQLLQSGLLNDIEIDCIVDSHPKKWGRIFEGYSISSPQILKGKDLAVLISSYDGQEEISDYLKTNFPHISQIKLYEKEN